MASIVLENQSSFNGSTLTTEEVLMTFQRMPSMKVSFCFLFLFFNLEIVTAKMFTTDYVLLLKS